jgi:ubiquinone/menaquinone biosynthesis C-methylase UbiE
MKINSDKLLIIFGRIFKSSNHPFELENRNIMSFEEWEFKKAPKTLSYFKENLDLNNCFKGKDILDIGCGGGGKTAYLLKFSPGNIVGLDMNDEFIEKATKFSKRFKKKENSTLSFIKGNAENLPFESNSFDFATMMDTFEHFSNPIKVLNETRRVLKKDGLLLISFPPYYHPYGAHVKDLMPLPWVHLFFSEKAIATAYYKLSFYKKDGDRRRKLKIGREKNGNYNINYINNMTINKCTNILKSVDLNLKYFKLIPLGNFLIPLLKIDNIKELLVKNVVVILKKGD